MRRYWNKEVRLARWNDFYHYSPESAAFDLGLERAGKGAAVALAQAWKLEPFCQKVLAESIKSQMFELCDCWKKREPAHAGLYNDPPTALRNALLTFLLFPSQQTCHCPQASPESASRPPIIAGLWLR